MPLLVEGVYLVGFIKNAPLPGRSEIPAMLILPEQKLLWMKCGDFCNTEDKHLLGAICFRDSYFKHHRNANRALQCCWKGQLLTLWGRSGINYYPPLAGRVFALREPCALSLWSLWKGAVWKDKIPFLLHRGMSIRVTAALCDGVLRYCEPGMCTGIWESIRSVTTMMGDSPWRWEANSC